MLVYQYGHHVAENMARVFNKPGPITIRRNAIKCPSDEILCQQLLRDDSITAKSCESFTTSLSPHGCIKLVVNDSWSPGKKSIWSLDSWKNGLFEVQDAGSQLIARATEAVGGDVVVDYCAGNGGKTFALASHIYGIEQEREVSAGTSMDDRETRIIAHDIVEDRLRQLRGSFDRTGLGTDQSSFTSHKVNVLTTLDSEISLEREMADVVLVDAPCSSTGVLRRRPSQRFKLKRDEIINKFPTLQGTLLKDGSELVKVGGSLVYATCSICRHENEDVVRGFECSFGFDDKWKRWNFNGKDDDINGHCLQILPTLNGTDGFFIARWKRI
jgi:16S rRNA (cytosine967-C5)-methyltransferase